MADTLKIESVNMKDILGTKVNRHGGKICTDYSMYSEETKRQLAVTAVLEIIKSNGETMSIYNLKEYTDVVFAAMEGKLPE